MCSVAKCEDQVDRRGCIDFSTDSQICSWTTTVGSSTPETDGTCTLACDDGACGGGDESFCTSTMDLDICLASETCAYDYDIGLCRAKLCIEASSELSCSAISDSCVWLAGSDLCFAPGDVVSCDRFLSCQQCPPGRCNFDLSQQLCVEWGDCVDVYSQDSCTDPQRPTPCQWIPHTDVVDGRPTGVCEDIPCTELFESSLCRRTSQCAWNDTIGRCSEVDGGHEGTGDESCSAAYNQDDEDACTSAGECIFTPTIYPINTLAPTIIERDPIEPRICYNAPTQDPVTNEPSPKPSASPSTAPASSVPSGSPSSIPTTLTPTKYPTPRPTTQPPSMIPTIIPTLLPSQTPTVRPTYGPAVLWRPGARTIHSTSVSTESSSNNDNTRGPVSISSNDKNIEEQDDSLAIIILAVIGILIVLGIAIITLLIRRRSASRLRENSPRIQNVAANPSYNRGSQQTDLKQQGGSIRTNKEGKKVLVLGGDGGANK